MKFLKKIASKEEAVAQEYNVLYATDTEVIVKKAPKMDYTFGTIDSHTKAKADAFVGDICYYGETPIGVVVIKGDDTVKIMSLFELKEDGTNSLDHNTQLTWGTMNVTTDATDENNGKANTEKLVAIGSDYEAAVACSLYSTEGTSKGDWYLPAIEELWKVLNIGTYDRSSEQWKTNVIQAALLSLNSLAEQCSVSGYWTSTEVYYSGAWILHCNPTKTVGTKTSGYFVRAFCEI